MPVSCHYHSSSIAVFKPATDAQDTDAAQTWSGLELQVVVKAQKPSKPHCLQAVMTIYLYQNDIRLPDGQGFNDPVGID